MLLPLFRSRRIDVRSHWEFLREREIRGLSSIFGAARKYGSGWIGQVILIVWKCSATLTVKLNYAPNKKSKFLSATSFSCVIKWLKFFNQISYCYFRQYLPITLLSSFALNSLKWKLFWLTNPYSKTITTSPCHLWCCY